MHDEQVYFDKVSAGYRDMDTGAVPIRHYSEAYTALKLAGRLESTTVLDVACSDGFFSRLLKKAGAASVEGMDLSTQMIELARVHEQEQPLGIQYWMGNILEDAPDTQFDLVYSSFLLTYAKDLGQLVEMCRALHRRLKPGGRLISMNDHPDLLLDSVTGFVKYGKTKRVVPGLVDGATVTVTWVASNEHGESQAFSFNSNYYTRETLAGAMREAGFTDVCFHDPQVSPEGLERMGREYWDLFLRHPLLVFITARRTEQKTSHLDS